MREFFRNEFVQLILTLFTLGALVVSIVALVQKTKKDGKNEAPLLKLSSLKYTYPNKGEPRPYYLAGSPQVAPGHFAVQKRAIEFKVEKVVIKSGAKKPKIPFLMPVDYPKNISCLPKENVIPYSVVINTANGENAIEATYMSKVTLKNLRVPATQIQIDGIAIVLAENQKTLKFVPQHQNIISPNNGDDIELCLSFIFSSNCEIFDIKKYDDPKVVNASLVRTKGELLGSEQAGDIDQWETIIAYLTLSNKFGKKCSQCIELAYNNNIYVAKEPRHLNFIERKRVSNLFLPTKELYAKLSKTKKRDRYLKLPKCK